MNSDLLFRVSAGCRSVVVKGLAWMEVGIALFDGFDGHGVCTRVIL